LRLAVRASEDQLHERRSERNPAAGGPGPGLRARLDFAGCALPVAKKVDARHPGLAPLAGSRGVGVATRDRGDLVPVVAPKRIAAENQLPALEPFELLFWKIGSDEAYEDFLERIDRPADRMKAV